MSLEDALKAAIAVREKAYAGYSRFHVGTALKLKNNDQLFCGCNVENVSYGATVCAERVAIFSAVAALGKIEPEYLVLVTDNDPVVVPCGMCLQVLSEFCAADMPIYLGNLKGIQKQVSLAKLLPQQFDKSSLPNQ